VTMIQDKVAFWRGRPCRERARNRHDYSSGPDWRNLVDAHPTATPSVDCPSALPFDEVLAHALRRCPSITMSPERMGGRPCIAGTRIPVHLVLWAIEHRGSIEGAIMSYPDLTTQQVKDALYFAETIMGSQSALQETTLIA